jgi:hypothetical protein
MSRLATWRQSVVLAGLLASFTAFPVQALADYELGRGYSLFDGRLTIGGYLSLEAEFLDQTPDRFQVDDISTFLTFRITDRWLVFTEMEAEDPVHVDGDGVGSGENVFRLERLYTQWLAGDRLRFRVGKMLTPIGIWNLIHAQPLVWSTSRPIATEQFFDTGLTGLEATFFAPLPTAELAFTAFGQATRQLDNSHDSQDTRRGFGARLELTPDRGPKVGASFFRFRDRNDGRTETTVGADAIWSTHLAEVSSEWAVNIPDSGETTWGAYLQGVAHVGWQLHPFLRLEYADLGSYDRVPVVLGVAWKPLDAMVIKLEGIVGGHDTSLDGDGVLTSFSVLF